MKRFVIKVRMVEVLNLQDDVQEVPESPTMMWLISATTRDEAFDRAMRYFLEGAPKRILNADPELQIVEDS